MVSGLQAILIGGSSHTGKSTLAKELSEQLGWKTISTDQLARHPGRPWPSTRPQVAEFYSKLSEETIYWFLRVHHENIWPRLHQIIRTEITTHSRFVFEGSALRPEFVAELVSDRLLAFCLYADASFLRDRMRAESQYWQQSEEQRQIIDVFIHRSLKDNEICFEEAQKQGIPILNVGTADNISNLAATIMNNWAAPRMS